jgi:type VI secretion system protein ImpJ
MSINNRVVWTEGLFLRPQHFQQAERFLESLIENRVGPGLPYGHGFTRLELDAEMLKLGRVGITKARGIMPDGTPFAFPEEGPAPAPLEIPPDCKDTAVLLALPLRRSGMPEISYGSGKGTGLTRYTATDMEVADNIAEMQGSAEMQVGTLNLKLVFASEPTESYTTLGFAHILEKRSSGVVALSDGYIAPSLDCRADQTLLNYLREISSLLRHRAASLAERMGQPGQKGVSEIADFLMLQVANRFSPLFAHLLAREPLHPESLYLFCLQLAGELATFTHSNRRPTEFPAYRHDALAETFFPLIKDIRESLSSVLNQGAIALELQDKGRGLYAVAIPDLDLLRTASFVLAVNAQVPAESLRQLFPTQVKIGSAEKIRDLVMSQLPGIVLQPLPVAPRQIPFHAGFTYFELDRHSDLWKGMEINRLLAMHIAGDFPDLQMELWGIRA